MQHRNRGLRFCLPLVVIAASLAIFASSASAFVWTVEGTGALETGESVATTLHLKKETSVTLSATIAGAKVTFTATGLEGVGTKLGANGTDSGAWKLKGTTVNIANCKLPSETVETSALKGELVEVSSTLYDKIVPVKEGGPIATFTLEGASCALAGVTLELTGSLIAQVEPLETELVEQPFEFSPTIETAGGGTLKLGSVTAKFTMSARMEVVPPARKFGPLPAAPRYRMGAYGAGLSAEGNATENQVFNVNGKTISCTTGVFSSALAGPVEKLQISPTLANCTPFELGAPNTVSFQREGCAFESKKPKKAGGIYNADAAIACGGGHMTFEILNGASEKVCEVAILRTQEGANFELKNKIATPRWVELKPNAIGLEYNVTKKLKACPLESNVYFGDYTGAFGLNGIPAPGKEFFIE